MKPDTKLERRRKRRIEGPYPTIVRGVDESGAAFEASTTLDNLSASGIYVKLEQRVEQGAQLFIVVQLSMSASDQMPPPRVAIRGEAVRVEPHPDGGFGVAVEIKRHRFL